MSNHAHTHDIGKEIRGYFFIFAALLVLTVVTVLANKIHLALQLTVTMALFIAAIKASLVACYFMHLISERKLIYIILSFTVFFFLCMIFLFYAGYFDILVGSSYTGEAPVAHEATEHTPH